MMWAINARVYNAYSNYSSYLARDRLPHKVLEKRSLNVVQDFEHDIFSLSSTSFSMICSLSIFWSLPLPVYYVGFIKKNI